MLADYIYTITLIGVIIVLILLLILLPLMLFNMRKLKAVTEKLGHMNDALFGIDANFTVMHKSNVDNDLALMNKLTIIESKQISIKDLIDSSIKGTDKCLSAINALNRRSNKPIRCIKNNNKGNTPPKV